MFCEIRTMHIKRAVGLEVSKENASNSVNIGGSGLLRESDFHTQVCQHIPERGGHDDQGRESAGRKSHAGS